METLPAVLGKFSPAYGVSFDSAEELFTNVSRTFRHTLIPPRGYSIAGIYGSCGPWIDGFGLIITR
jgi:hypothetical protein